MHTMNERSSSRSGRRRFLASTSALGVASLLGFPRTASAEPPPETTTVRLVHAPAICLAPQYLAEELLRLEGFSHLRYVELADYPDPVKVLEAGEADFTQDSWSSVLPNLDAGTGVVTVLAGIHVGCFELFATEKVATIKDLKGKRVAVTSLGASDDVFIASMAAYVGIDPRTEINWVAMGGLSGKNVFAEGKADAFLAFAPEPQKLRARKVGHVIVDTAQDKPWSQYFCCMLSARRAFIQAQPIATKRIVRAF